MIQFVGCMFIPYNDWTACCRYCCAVSHSSVVDVIAVVATSVECPLSMWKVRSCFLTWHSSGVQMRFYSEVPCILSVFHIRYIKKSHGYIENIGVCTWVHPYLFLFLSSDIPIYSAATSIKWFLNKLKIMLNGWWIFFFTDQFDFHISEQSISSEY